MIDMAVWDAIKDSQDPKDFETFVETYPDSPLVRFALNRIMALRTARAAAAPSEPAPTVGTAPTHVFDWRLCRRPPRAPALQGEPCHARG